MSVSLVGSANATASSNSTKCTTANLNTTGANLLVHVCGCANGTGPGISDTFNNTWNSLNSYGSSGGAIYAWYALNPTVGANHQVVNNGSDTFPMGILTAWSGLASGNCYESQNGAPYVTANNAQTGSVTPNTAGDLVLAVLNPGNQTSANINESFTKIQFVATVGGVSYGIAIAYLLPGNTAALDPTWSWANNTSGGASIAAFALAGAVVAVFPELCLLGAGAQ